MARTTSQGKNWARILSTVLFALATLELLSALEGIGKDGVAQAFFAGLTWLSGLAAVWMLWRPGLQRVLQVGQGGAVAAANSRSWPFREPAPQSREPHPPHPARPCCPASACDPRRWTIGVVRATSMVHRRGQARGYHCRGGWKRTTVTSHGIRPQPFNLCMRSAVDNRALSRHSVRFGLGVD